VDPNTPPVKRIVIWSNQTGLEHTVSELMQRNGIMVIEHARVQQVSNEQNIQLTHTRDDDASILRIGKLLGADHVIFAEATIKGSVFSEDVTDVYGGPTRKETMPGHQSRGGYGLPRRVSR